MPNPEHLKILERGVEHWNRWRESDNIIPDLSNADLSYENLAGINLERARLFMVNFDAAVLNGANFSAARLYQSSFIGASLWNANFTHTALDYVLFQLADVASANFLKSEMGFTSFANTSLLGATGLDTCNHLGPSSIDFHTLRRSGALPKRFLQGCGLPDELISKIPMYLDKTNNFYSCFISYSHRDKAFANSLHDKLQTRGIRCWLDEHQMLPGDDLHDRIDEGIRLWDKILLCASQHSLTSWWVDAEINRAFQKEEQLMKERGKKIIALIPINLDGFLFSHQYSSGKKAEIKSRVAANLVGWESDENLFSQQLEKIIRALKADEGGRELPPPKRL